MTAPLPRVKLCSYCEEPAMGWFWSQTQGYVGWCREHVTNQRIEATEEPDDRA